MIPHLGVLSTVHLEAALQIFENDCRVMLGTCVAFSGKLTEKDYGKDIANIKIKMPDGEVVEKRIEYGTIQRIELEEGKTAEIEGNVASPFSLTTAEGSGRRFSTKVEGGVVGIVIDARGRPIVLPKDDEVRRGKLREWFGGLDAYPAEVLEDKF
jgi:hypothetical protein